MKHMEFIKRSTSILMIVLMLFIGTSSLKAQSCECNPAIQSCTIQQVDDNDVMVIVNSIVLGVITVATCVMFGICIPV